MADVKIQKINLKKKITSFIELNLGKFSSVLKFLIFLNEFPDPVEFLIVFSLIY